MKKTLFTLVITCFFTHQLMACSCFLGSFCEQIASYEDPEHYNFDKQGIICHVRPTGNCQEVLFQNSLCQYEVIEVLYGEITSHSDEWVNTDEHIWILGGNGADCLSYVSSDTSETYLFTSVIFSFSDDYMGYSTSICSDDLLKIVDGQISGFIFDEEISYYYTPNTDTLNFAEFKEGIFNNCLNKDVPNNVLVTPSISTYECYPNPTSSILNIDCPNNGDFSGQTLHLYAIDGRRVWSGQMTSSSITLDLSRFDNGVYYLVEGGATGRFLEKVMVFGGGDIY